MTAKTKKYKAPTIRELAHTIAGKHEYTSAKFVEKELRNLRSALLNNRYYTRVDTVSKSGMSRIVVAAYLKDNKMHRVLPCILTFLGGADKNGRVHGCGMDMLFSTQYNLFMGVCPRLKYQDKMTRYNLIP